MNLRLLHRRLAVLMAASGLVAFAGGAGMEPTATVLAALALTTAFFWQPSRDLSARLERVWLPLAALLVIRALIHVFVVRDDVVIPVVDLLFLLLAAESLRSLDAPNDVRLYALSFALLLAATAYRPGVLFLAAFVAFVALATLGLMVGHLRRKAERHGVREIPLERGLVLATGGLTGVVLLISLIVFLAFPRVSRGWAGRGQPVATSIAGFSDQVSIGEHGSRIYGNPQIVLRVEFPSGRPGDVQGLHWRGRSYDRFDGVRWSRSPDLPPSSGPTRWYMERWTAPRLEQRIYAAPLDVRVLFAVHPVLDVDPENGIQPLFDNHGDLVYWGSGAPAYTAWSPVEGPAAADLRAVDRGYAPPARFFLQLPELDPRIDRLADSLTAGQPTRYDKVAAVQRHLRSFAYTLDLPATSRETSLDHFLFRRRAGHCEYFSTAMVVLLRAAGIEARNVNGFLGGVWNEFGGYLAVTQNQAHSWVEVWFPEYGWVTFDPTPPGAASEAGGQSWFWPGRIFFDGIQHRWSKWVLDYDMDVQAGMLEGWFNAAESPPVQEIVSRATGSAFRALWGPTLLLLALAGGGWWAARGRRRHPAGTRIYLDLVRSCSRAGVPVSPGLTPKLLLHRVRQTRSQAADPTERVVELYLRGRYGGEPLDTEDLRAMTRALDAARRSLRERG